MRRGNTRKTELLPPADVLTDMVNKARETGGLIYGIVLCGLMLGLRRGEMAGLQFGDFDLEHGTVHIQRQVRERGGAGPVITPLKTVSSDRVIGIPDAAAEYVKAQREYASDASDGDVNGFYLFGEGIALPSPGSMEDAFADFLKANGLPKMSIYGLRHAYTFSRLGEGIPLNTVSAMLGV